jgi:hypothetical protein
MTRRLPPDKLNVHAALEAKRLRESVAAEIFKDAPPWQLHAALAALHRFRPDFGESDPTAHAVHMLNFARNDLYFARVCRLLKAYGVGTQWGEG